MKTEAIIENYLNGNLADAKKAAKRKSWQSLYDCLRQEYGRNIPESRKIADYLKRQI